MRYLIDTHIVSELRKGTRCHPHVATWFGTVEDDDLGLRSIPVVDGLLAATARVHGLTLVTRNVRDVAWTDVACRDPFQAR